NNIVLSGGSIQDRAGNDSTLNFTPPVTNNILVDSLIPKITSIVVPGQKYYLPGDELKFNLNFNENVFVSNIPILNIKIGGINKEAIYQSGSGTDVLTFTYNVEDNTDDNDGIEIASNITLENFSFIKDSSGNLANTNIPNTCSGGVNLAYDVSEGTPFTNESSGVGQSCMSLLPSAPALNDAYYFGFTSTFNAVQLNISTAGVGSWDLTWEYFNGSWVALSNLADGTSNFTEPGLKKVTWDMPSDWVTTSGGGLPATNYYYVRARVSSFSSKTVVPIGGQVSLENIRGIKIDTGGPIVAKVSLGNNVVEPIFRANFENTLTNDKGADGTAENGTSFSFDSAINNNSLLLGGRDDERVLFPYDSRFNNPKGTYYLWFKTDGNWGVNGDDQGLLGKGRSALITSETSDAKYGVNIFLEPSGEIRAIFRGSTDQASVCLTPPGTSYLDNQWHNLVVTFGKAVGYTNKIYVDGAEVISCDNINEIEFGANSLLIGDSLDPFNEEYKGLIDDIRIFNFDRNPIEINNKAYKKGESIYLSLEMSESIKVTGVPYVVANIGGSVRRFLFDNVIDSNILRFKHQVEGGENDNDGININSPIILENHSIKDSNDNNANIQFNPPLTPYVLVDTIKPYVKAVTFPNSGTYKEGDEILISLELNESVVIQGEPTISIKIGTQEVKLTYESSMDDNILNFKYIIEDNLNDFDGISLFSIINLSNSSIIDFAGNDISEDFSNLGIDLSAIKIDSTRPYIVRVETPQNGYYFPGDTIIFDVVFNEVVFNDPDPGFIPSFLRVSLGNKIVQASYISGTGTNRLRYSYNVIANDDDNDGIELISPLELNGFNIYDSVNNIATVDFTVPDLKNLRIDSGAPTITQVLGPVDGNYKTGDDLIFDVVFSEEIIVLGLPFLSLQIGAETKNADLFSQISKDTLRFKYTVEEGLQDTDGILINANLVENLSEVRDSQNNETNYLFNEVPLNSVLVDSVRPSVTSITIPTNGTYSIGDKLVFDVSFDEDVNVTNEPRLALDIGGVLKYALFQNQISNRVLRFEYEVEIGLVDLGGISFTNQAIDLNSIGLIKDNSNNDAVLSFTGPNLSGIRVNALVPIITSVVIPPGNIFRTDNELNFTMIFNKT
ncbi:MAG: LamG domain-containing protein, partial [Bdellovibrionales bacterium]|nr:LamG domain-containing protein [Bdellovibrionales bacterium]